MFLDRLQNIDAMTLNKSGFVTLCLLVFSALAIGDLGVDAGGLTALKYASIVAICASMIIAQGIRGAFDRVSVVALAWFIFFVLLFTTINSPDVSALSILVGYVVCLIFYIVSSAAHQNLFRSVDRFLVIFAIVFSLVNVPFVFDPSAYSAVKNQFSGILANANAFSGLCGFLFVFCLSKFYEETHFLRRTGFLLVVVVMSLYMLLSSSRGAMLAAFLSVCFIPLTKTSKSFIVVAVLGYALMKWLSSNSDAGFGFADRDFFEETGRGDLLALYMQKITDSAFIGVGLSEASGRIKSELSYLDIILFSGVGALGFFVFIGRGVYFSVINTFGLRRASFSWPIPIYIYICIASIFEGYAANIGSVPSIFLYISAGFVYRASRLKRLANVGVLR